MSEIPEELVEETWQTVAGFSPHRARQDMEKAGREQPGLLTFVMAFTDGCRPQVQELAVYLYFVIHQVFKRATERRLRPIKVSKIEKQMAENEERLARFETAHPRFLEKAALLELSAQPHVVKYLVEAIMEAPEGEDPVELTAEESGTLFLVLKTVIDLLDEERQRAEAV